MNTILLDTLVALIPSTIITGVAYLTYRNHKNDRQKIGDNKDVTLESVRDMFERQMYAINDRLVKNEERWRDVNHLLLTDHTESETYYQRRKSTFYSDFLKSNGLVESDLIVDSRLIFLITPYNGLFYDEYKIIQGVCSSKGYNCIRGDETTFKGEIIQEMIKYITKATLVIVNVNGRAPNVMYELGIAHALDKSVILISHEPEGLPVDIKAKRFIFYKSTDELINKLKDELDKFQGHRGK